MRSTQAVSEYVIDLATEDVFSLRELPNRLRIRQGAKLHVSTGYRWAQQGLPTLTVGGSTVTSIQAVQWWCERRSRTPGVPVAVRTTAGRRKAVAAADRQLDKLGV